MKLASTARRRYWLRALEGYAFVSLALIGITLFQVGPMLASLGLSFTEYQLVRPPRYIGVANFQRLFTDPLFWKSLWNTVYYVAVGLPLRLVIAFLAALLLNQRLRGIGAFRTIYYIPSVTAGVAISIVWTYVYDPEYGLMNYVLSWFGIQGPAWLGSPEWAMPALIIMSFWQLGVPMLIFLAGLQNIPTHLYEAAALDGAGVIQRVRYVTIPLLTPLIFFNLVMGVISSFQVFTQVFIMTGGGPLHSTLVYVLYLYNQSFLWFRMGVGSAMAWILFIIIFTLTLIQFRFSKWVYYEGDLGGRGN